LKKVHLIKLLNVVKYLAIYYLSIKMICFAIPKFLHMQFRILHYQSFIPLVETSKYQHMWSFFGRSYNYNLYIGLVEFLIGVLIVFRKTRLIALLLSIAVCSNILILNIEFDIYFAIQHITVDLILTTLLLVEYRKDLYRFFIELGGKLKDQVSSTTSGYLIRLTYLYIIVFPVAYFIFAYNLRAGVNEEIVGSYKIKSSHVSNDYFEFEKGKLGASPMLFFEHNNLAVLSVNDSLFFGGYSIKEDKVNIYFNPPIDQKIRSIKGELKNNVLLKGKINNSISVELEIEKLPAEEDYLNNLYIQ